LSFSVTNLIVVASLDSTYMKSKSLLPAALLALVSLTAHAGDSKDMKDMKQVSKPECPPDAGFYVAAYGGVNFSTDYGDRRTVISAGGTNANVTPDNVHSDIGAVGGIKGGYNFNSFPIFGNFRLQPAVEAEAMYISMRSKSSNNGTYDDSTSYNNGAGFINGILRFKSCDGFFSRFNPYIGVGVGAEYITAHTHLDIGGADAGNAGDQDLDFAAQALAGFDYKLNQHWTLFTEYKFIDALGTNLRSPGVAGGLDYSSKPDQLAQNVATVGVKYNF
jgi:opacity protein-like surface antigen